MAEPWTARQGTDAKYDVALRNTASVVLTNVYDGSETFALAVWAGDDRQASAMAGSSAAWKDGAPQNGVVRVVLARADLAALTPGPYRLLLRLTTGGETYDAFATKLIVEPQPGSGAALPTGGLAFDRLLRVSPTLKQFVLADPAQQSDFAEQRNTAWLWLRRALLYRAERLIRWYAAGNLQPHGGDPVLGPDLDWSDAGIDARLTAIAAALDGGGLDLSDGAALDAMAHHAVAEILDPNPGPAKEGETNWQRLGRHHRRCARAAVRAYVARVDVSDPDGRRVVLRPLGGI